MPQPRITVITPNLNHGRFLERAICSVLDQGYANLEYLVIDAGSTDDSEALIRLYEDRLAWWTIHPTATAAAAINLGLERASGELVIVVNSTDLLLPGALHEAARHMTRSGADWMAGHCLRIDESDRPIGELQACPPASVVAFLMHNSGFVPASATCWRRELFKQYGCFDASMRRAHLFEFACRLLIHGHRPSILPVQLAAGREHAAGVDAAQVVQHNREMIEASERYADRLAIPQRYVLWANCDVRRRILALAQAEMNADGGRRVLWRKLLRRPWWLTNDSYRHTLLHGLEQRAGSVAAARDGDVMRPAA